VCTEREVQKTKNSTTPNPLQLIMKGDRDEIPVDKLCALLALEFGSPDKIASRHFWGPWLEMSVR
jgi:hypothetical protein